MVDERESTVEESKLDSPPETRWLNRWRLALNRWRRTGLLQRSGSLALNMSQRTRGPEGTHVSLSGQ